MIPFWRHGLLIEEAMIEEEPVLREEQPCWCPDAFRDNGFSVVYCPAHGREPEAALWDSSVEPFPG